MDAFVAELARATRFVDAAIAACAAARQLGAARTIVELACASGEPALLVDDAPDVAATAWWMVAPLVGPQGELGVLRFASAAPLPREIERQLALVATHLS